MKSGSDQETGVVYGSNRISSGAFFKQIEKCAIMRDLSTGRALHARLVINGVARLTHFASKLISMYAECGQVKAARKVFDKIPTPNYRRWIVLIGAFAKGGHHHEALKLLKEMQQHHVMPNNYVIPSILKACGHLSELQTGKMMHALVLRSWFDHDPFVISSLIDMYSRCREIDKASRVFDGVATKDIVAVNAMVSGFVQVGLVKAAFGLVENLQKSGVHPNVVTWNTLISGFSQAGDDSMADELFRLMKINGVEPDVVSWTSIISGLVQNFRNDEAFATFKKMLGSGCRPSSNTIGGLLPACANAANVGRGREIHAYAISTAVDSDVYVRSALIDMYGKCGFIFQATKLFQQMPAKNRNTVTYNSMIFAYANNGYCNEAIRLFDRMEVEGGRPDHLTFTAALTACSHGGLAEVGERVFREMKERRGIEPRMEHYALMVDLIGRAGRVREAYEVVRRMPVAGDVFVWGALMGACRQHGEVEVGEIAALELAALEPEGGGGKVLMSSLYQEAGNWGGAARVKRRMKKEKAKKVPGCSWVEAA